MVPFKSKYFCQLYTLYAYFPPIGRYDNESDRVWVKRMLPRAWIFMKRRRTKDFIRVLKSLAKEAEKYQLTLAPK